MKKVLAYICVLIGLGALGISSARPLMHKIFDWNNKHIDSNSLWCKHNNMGGGDLVKLSFLDDIKKFWERKDYHFDKAQDTGNRNIDLYLYGDSYTEDMPDSIFAHVHAYHYGTKLKGLNYVLGTGKRNILVIEITERLAMETFSGTGIYDVLKGTSLAQATPVKSEAASPTAPLPAPTAKKSFNLVTKTNFSQIINTNLEYLLFDYKCINKIRQCKADMNYGLFHHASGDVAISDNGDYIFYKPTITQGGPYSIYTPLTDADINNTVAILNDIYDHYKKEGFAEVYFSVIPNAATILQPKGYNSFIPRLYKNGALKMPVIDIYSIYSRTPNPATLYRMGDTHWNNSGMQLWLGLLNDELRKQSELAR